MSVARCYLLSMMPVSWLLGIVMFASGVILRFKFGEAASFYIEGVSGVVDLTSARNEMGQSISPVSEEIPNHVAVGYWAIYFSALLIVNGTVLILYSTMGYVGVMKGVTLMCVFVIICIPISVTIDFYIYYVLKNSDADFHKSAKEDMVKLVRNYYSIEGDSHYFSELLNGIMIMYKCCGINGPGDFNNLTFVEFIKEPNIHLFSVPPACCLREIFNSGYSNLKTCAVEGMSVPDRIQSRGCYDTAFSHLQSPKASFVFYFLVVTIMWSIMELILLVIILISFSQGRNPSIASTKTSGSGRAAPKVPQTRDSQGSYLEDIKRNQTLNRPQPQNGAAEASTGIQNPNPPVQNQLIQEQYPLGQLQYPLGQLQNPLGQLQNPIGQIQYPLGQLQNQLGQLQYPLGQLQYPLGQQQYPVGQQQYPVGQQQYPLGQQQYPVGQQQYPLGQQQYPQGQQQYPVVHQHIISVQQQYPTAGQQRHPVGQQSALGGQAQPPSSQPQTKAPSLDGSSKTQQASASGLRAQKQDSEAASTLPIKMTPMETAQEVLKKYATPKVWPLVKPSSFNHPQVGRIKSTTIW